MSTRLLYHAFGVRGYCYMRTSYEGGDVHLTVEHSDYPRDGWSWSRAVCVAQRAVRATAPYTLPGANPRLPAAPEDLLLCRGNSAGVSVTVV